MFHHNLLKFRGSDQWFRMERFAQKGVAWECCQRSGVRVKGQGSEPAGQHTRGDEGEKRRGGSSPQID